jgi:hypothetical protein
MPGSKVCRVCGVGIRDTDDVMWVRDELLHTACTEAHQQPKRRRIGSWAAMGSSGQMAMGDVQSGKDT